jgi:DNA polymerase-3 subunit gamma/tau
MDVLTDAEGRLRDAASKKIFVEVVLLRSIQARNAVSIDTVLGQLTQLRAETGGNTVGAASSPVTAAPAAAPARTSNLAPTPASVPSSTPVAASTPAPHPTGDADLLSLWAAILDAVGRASPFTKTYLIEAHPVSLVKGVFTIGFDPEFAQHIDMVNNQKNHALLQTKLAELGHPGAQVKFIKAERPEGWAAVTPADAPPTTPAQSATPAGAAAAKPAAGRPDNGPSAPASIEDFKNDPLIRQALEIFRGQIVEVRA